MKYKAQIQPQDTLLKALGLYQANMFVFRLNGDHLFDSAKLSV